MNCLLKAWEYAMSVAHTDHKVLIAHAFRGDGDFMPHAFNIDLCCNLAIDISDANPHFENNENIRMNLAEYLKEQQIDAGKFLGFKTYTLKEYNKKFFKENGVHMFYDLRVFTEEHGYVPLI